MSQSPWDLVKAKKYAEAAEAYSRNFVEDGDLISLGGRAKALLLADRPAEARDDFARVIHETEPRYRGAGDYLDLGTCHWYLGQPAEAVCNWRLAQLTPYTDAAGGVVCLVFLLYAGVRLGDPDIVAESDRLLREKWQTHRQQTHQSAHETFVHPGLLSWPGALVPFLLTEIDSDRLDATAANSVSGILRSRHQCQADFAKALRALREGDHDVFRSRMARSAANLHGELEHEFCLARWEVTNRFPQTPFAG